MKPHKHPIVHHKELSHGHIVVSLYPSGKNPAIGGMRRIKYPSLDEAILDCKNLALAMLCKATAHDLPLSGGKSVIYCSDEDWAKHRSQITQEAGLFIDTLAGRYITAIDMGTHMLDMDRISLVTEHVCAHSKHDQTAYYTALGVYYALLGACSWNNTDLNKANILIEGLGQVSTCLIQILEAHQAQLFGIDINPKQLDAHAHRVKPYQPGQHIDIFCPNASGGSISKERAKAIGCQIICGAANNQIVPHESIDQLPCLTVPDYIANGGGLIYVYHKMNHSSLQQLESHIKSIQCKTREFLETLRFPENAS